MQQIKQTKVYTPTLENAFDVAGTTIKDNGLIGLKEQNLYCFTKKQLEELFNELSDYGYNFLKNKGKLYSHTNNAYQELKQQQINKLLNNE